MSHWDFHWQLAAMEIDRNPEAWPDTDADDLARRIIERGDASAAYEMGAAVEIAWALGLGDPR